MTHDIKNLLQSLNVLCAAAAREDDRDSPELQALMRRQLPVIAQRLSDTLEKLQRPEPAEEQNLLAQGWWDGLVRQYQSEGVQFGGTELPPEGRVPRSVFDNVADNLIRNALAKRAAEAGVSVRVEFEYGEDVALRVRDTGRAVPPELEPTLLQAPISSHGGLGIGLYQAARLAASSGYRLILETNRDGNVCFALSGPPI
jgi:signal transduction histidine kinase